MMNSREQFNHDHKLPHRNVFVMMRFDDTPQHRTILTTLQESLNYYGFEALRADDTHYETGQLENVRLYMEGCEYGIAVFDQIYEKDFNPNVALELGYMLGQGKRCLILKEKRIQHLPSDLAGSLYRGFDGNHDYIEPTLKEQIEQWMQDLHIVPDEDEKVIVFVSQSGIDRCAMAKALLIWLLRTKTRPDMNIRVESAGKKMPYFPRARKSAMKVIKEFCGEDLLANHKPQLLSEMLKERADLILTMTESLTSELPSSKTMNLKPFFGLKGDVDDPIFDNEDQPSFERYMRVGSELKEILETEGNLGKLFDYLRHPSDQV